MALGDPPSAVLPTLPPLGASGVSLGAPEGKNDSRCFNERQWKWTCQLHVL